MKKPITDQLPRGVISQVRNYGKLMRVNKPVGIWLLLWPVLWALWLAGEGHPDQGLFVVFMLGVFVMRSAGCVLNDYADRNIDPYVERTRLRPIACGAVTPFEALILFATLGLIALGLASMLNRQAQLLAIVAAVLTIVYPFIKRFLSIPQFVLGAAFGWALRQRSGLPMLHNVRRTRATPFQSGLDAAARSRNLRQAFTSHGCIRAQHVLIVDDVITTGATCRELAKVVLAAGAKKVSVLAVARTETLGQQDSES